MLRVHHMEKNEIMIKGAMFTNAHAFIIVTRHTGNSCYFLSPNSIGGGGKIGHAAQNLVKSVHTIISPL